MQAISIPLRGESFAILVADFESGYESASRVATDDPSAWDRARPGRWSVGQHLDHLSRTLEQTLTAYERAVAELRAGTLAPVPARGLLQAAFVAIAVKRGALPRGGRTARGLEASEAPDRAATLAHVAALVTRYRALGEALTASERDRVWIPNPFRPRWHYTYAESLRMHAVHGRHHAALMREITGSAS